MPNECISELATAFKVGGRRSLNKHSPLVPGNYWHLAHPEGLSNASAA